MQTVVEGAEDPHHGVGLGFAEAEPLGGVEHQGGVKHGKTQGGEGLDEEQGTRARGDAGVMRSWGRSAHGLSPVRGKITTHPESVPVCCRLACRASCGFQGWIDI
ncbi:hypothetical protein D3C78_1528380 [compost metagenome]